MIRPLRSQLERTAQAPQQLRAANWRPAATWMALGFLAGVVFWHVVGFWNFVSEAIFDDNAAQQLAQAPGVPPPPDLPRGDPIPIARTAGSTSTCVVLAINRTGGETSAQPCPAGTFHHRYAGLGVKRDFEPTIRVDDGTGVAAWATDLLREAEASLTVR